MKKAVLVITERFTDIDLFLAWDLFNRARLKEKELVVKIAGTFPVHTSVCGIKIDTHALVEEANDADLVFFVSGSGVREAIKDKHYLQRFALNPEKQVICSICSGALMLAALGLLKDITATTYPSTWDLLKSYGVTVIEDYHLVTHGNIGTAAGCLAAVDLAGWAIEKLYNEKIKKEVIASVLPVGQGQVCIY